MPTDVVMPQMGESIFEGTITKWLKKPGDKIQRDEPLFEISTDKVDAEIPAPASGVLKEIKIAEGATVQVNTVVAVIDAEGAAVVAAAPAAQPAQATRPAEPATPVPAPAAAAPAPAPAASANGGPAVDVVMPQMGESIFEGTITKWLKKVGDKVQRDEPLFEISTDKVDAEIPAPASGVLREIKTSEGSTVQVNTVVAVIGGAGAPAAAATPAKPAPQPVAVAAPAARPQERPAAPQVTQFPAPGRGDGGQHLRSSPLVRRIARENSVDLASVPGTGLGGRISKSDILGFVQQHGAGAVAPAQRLATQPAPQVVPSQRPAAPAPVLHELTGELVPMTPMRKKIAERMVESRRTSAHVHTIFKVDMTRIVKFREKTRRQWEARNGVKLTFMPFIAKALMHGIRVKPITNASVAGDAIQYHKNVNIGIAVALEWGLIVPVVKQAENLSFVGLQRAISDVGERARNKKLVPDDVQGGTITITNPGIYGPQFGTPIILQPQLAILGMGGIFKEPVVVTDEDGNDSIAVRHIIRLVLGYDHRVIDGADADQFMVAVREYLENFNEDIG
ncbi:MAG TPA: 2-oxoglutarate dehydrogenase, E2 component, dihydrolipoamide succinyltransferase [Verrucomicrobiae bacterium]|jgi:pyruvate dehydrogenase E2 component (dihydrolipoamide acetyltransferase)|nr:2-oxoglutarate dehydrogenase, E2 component, dihydrolipoamide succinyltransferase [Verrucomicrobiae bacterium]